MLFSKTKREGGIKVKTNLQKVHKKQNGSGKDAPI